MSTRTGIVLGIVVVVVVVAAVIVVAVVGGRPDGGPPPTGDSGGPATTVPAPSAPVSPTAEPTGPAVAGETCPQATVTVSDADELQDALADAVPGAVIEIEEGLYTGEFVARNSGTAEEPIFLCGSADAVLDGGGVRRGYVLHLDGARYWHVTGFTVQNGQKGVMADGTVGSVISGLTVHTIGDEAIHLRRFSTDSVVSGNTISNTGLRREKFGEGVYVGSAESNWCDLTGCDPDRSDRNTVRDNVISDTTSEAIDIKEGTTGGVLSGNTFDGSSISAADSWVDVKGNEWLIEGNRGVDSPLDGFQTHEILDEWGDRNVFRNNTAEVNGPGFGYSLTPAKDNVLECSNTATDAGEGLSNVQCVTP